MLRKRGSEPRDQLGDRGRGRAEDRDGLSAHRQARLRRADSTQRPARWRRAPFREPEPACCCRAIFVRVRMPRRGDVRVAAGARRCARQRPGRPLLLVVNKDNVVEQRKVETGQLVGELRVIDERPRSRRPRRGRRHAARDPGPEGRAADRRPTAAARLTGRSMISKFFIDRPVLANVLAIVIVLIGARRAVHACRSRSIPNVVPPTVQVTTRYPGASAHTVIDTVALPIEQQVNGVEGMIYMQSTSADRRHLHADRHVRDRHRPRLRAGAGAEPRVGRARLAARGGAGAGRHRQEEVDRDPADRHADLAGRPLRQPVPEQLRHHQPDGRARAPARRRRRHRARRRPVLDARLARPAEAAGARPDAAGRDRRRSQQQSQQVAAGQVGAPPAPSGQTFQYTVNVARPARRRRSSSPTSSSRPAAPAARSPASTDVGRVELGAQTYGQIFKLERQAGGRHRASTSCPSANALDVADRGRAPRWRSSRKTFPAGPGLRRSRSTPRRSSTRRSTRSTRRCSRPASWC